MTKTSSAHGAADVISSTGNGNMAAAMELRCWGGGWGLPSVHAESLVVLVTLAFGFHWGTYIDISRSTGLSARRNVPFAVFVTGSVHFCLACMLASRCSGFLLVYLDVRDRKWCWVSRLLICRLFLPDLFMREQKSEISTASQNEFLQGQIQLYLCIL